MMNKNTSFGDGAETDSQNTSANRSQEQQRRSFITKLLAIVIGAFVSLFPAVAGLAVFLDPLRKRKKRDGKQQTVGPEGFLRVARLDDLVLGTPRRYTIIDDRVDAWNFFPQEPVGAVYLLRETENEVIALNVDCPHLGCPVDFNSDQQVYQCPCHNSSFQPTGEIANERSPSARALDSLVVDPDQLKNGEIWVKYQSFRSTTAKKIPEE